MKNTFLSLLAILIFSSAAISQNAKMVKTLDEKGPNGGIVQVYDDTYTIEMKRNAGSLEFYLSDSQQGELTAESGITGAVVINYSNQTDKSYVLEPGFDLTNIIVEDMPIYMVMIHVINGEEIFEARYYLKEGKMEQDYDKRLLELKQREAQEID